MTEAIEDTGGQVWVLGYHSPLFVRAQWLRALASRDFDLVILHTAPNDPVSLAAFGVSDGPPVALGNHADHIFWLGASVSDVLFNLRPVGARLSENRRFSGAVAPFRFPSADRRHRSCLDARHQLGIADDQRSSVLDDR